MQITISEDLLVRLSQLAEKQKRSVEAIISDRLFTVLEDELDSLPTGEQAELRALHYLSDDALRFIAAEKMAPENQILLKQLMLRNSEGALSDIERETLAALVEKGDQLMLRKAETIAILASRGHVSELSDQTTDYA